LDQRPAGSALVYGWKLHVVSVVGAVWFPLDAVRLLVCCLLCVQLRQLALTPYCVVMRPMALPLNSVNQTALVWAGPAVMPNGSQPNLF
jgi:hypothetical protein